jgi:molecular chaperone GrpE
MSEPRSEDSLPPETPDDTAPEVVPEADPSDAAALELRVAELEARLRSVSAAYQQKVEETALVRDRIERQARIAEEIRRGEVVQTFFEPVENLARSIEAAKGEPVESGLRMVHAQFLDALKRLGLEEVPGVGAPFNADIHEALATLPVQDPEQDGKVLQVYSHGYRIGSRLIRAARVVIGAYAAE